MLILTKTDQRNIEIFKFLNDKTQLSVKHTHLLKKIEIPIIKYRQK